jgi:hypothetical protein
MDDSKVREIVFSYNPYQEGLTTADATGLMVIFEAWLFCCLMAP